jgi:hypothetical protein
MPDLEDQLRAVDQVEVPHEDWRDVEVRALRRGPPPSRRSRLAPALVAVVIAATSIGLLIRAFGSHQPAPLTSSGRSETAAAVCGTWVNGVIAGAGNIGSSLKGIEVISATDAWTVGAYRDVPPTWQTPPTGTLGGPAPPERTTPLVEHWDGRSWTQVVVPNQDLVDSGLVVNGAPWQVGGTSFEAVSASGPDDVWVVGGGQAPVIEHWDGSTWSYVPSPDVNFVDMTLVDVKAISPDDAWAVGAGGGDGAIGPVIEHWDGSTWSVVSVPPVGIRYTEPLAIDASGPDDVWVVGQKWDEPLVLHWDGSAWADVASADVRAPRLTAVTAISPTDAWAVGTTYSDVNGNGPTLPLLEHWDGSRWSVIDTGALDGVREMVSITATSSSDIWAYGPNSSVLHFDGSEWTTVTPPSLGEYSDVGAASGTGPWLVGVQNEDSSAAYIVQQSSC